MNKYHCSDIFARKTLRLIRVVFLYTNKSQFKEASLCHCPWWRPDLIVLRKFYSFHSVGTIGTFWDLYLETFISQYFVCIILWQSSETILGHIYLILSSHGPEEWTIEYSSIFNISMWLLVKPSKIICYLFLPLDCLFPSVVKQFAGYNNNRFIITTCNLPRFRLKLPMQQMQIVNCASERQQ